MSFEGFLAIVFAVNLVCAVICSYVAHRSGHDPFPWALTAAVIGPIALITLVASRSPKPAAPPAEDVGRVLIPVDGSDPSLAAVEHFLAGPKWAGATLLCVLPVERQNGLPADRDNDIETNTGEARRRMERAGAKFDVQLAYGDRASEILRFAKEGSYRRIMMGRRGRGSVAKALLGSVSEKVVREAPIPVTGAD